MADLTSPIIVNTDINEFDSNMIKIDSLLDALQNKAFSVKNKIELFTSKNTLQLDDATQLLKFQYQIIQNEIYNLHTLKTLTVTNINLILYELSENITLFAASNLNIYKEIDIYQSTRVIKMSNNMDNKNKILTDIVYNLNFIRELLIDLQKYNDTLSDEMANHNFHCKTLKSDLHNSREHIYCEFNKFINTLDKTINYFIEFSDIINQKISNKQVLNFYIS